MRLDVPLTQIKNSRVLHGKLHASKKVLQEPVNALEGRPVLSKWLLVGSCWRCWRLGTLRGA